MLRSRSSRSRRSCIVRSCARAGWLDKAAASKVTTKVGGTYGDSERLGIRRPSKSAPENRGRALAASTIAAAAAKAVARTVAFNGTRVLLGQKKGVRPLPIG